MTICGSYGGIRSRAFQPCGGRGNKEGRRRRGRKDGGGAGGPLGLAPSYRVDFARPVPPRPRRPFQSRAPAALFKFDAPPWRVFAYFLRGQKVNRRRQTTCGNAKLDFRAAKTRATALKFLAVFESPSPPSVAFPPLTRGKAKRSEAGGILAGATAQAENFPHFREQPRFPFV